jgi:hypothetical protein
VIEARTEATYGQYYRHGERRLLSKYYGHSEKRRYSQYYEGEPNENRKTEIKIRNIAPLSYKLADMLPML